MITYYQHTNIDKTKWDACIDNAKNGLIYAYSWYLDIVSPNWDALILGDYEAVMPLPWRKKWGVKYIFQPPYCQQLGVFSNDEKVLSDVRSFIKKLPIKFVHVHTNFNVNNALISNEIKRFKVNKTCQLDLKPNYDLLYGKFSKNHKKNIKQGARNDFELKTIESNVALDSYIGYYKTKGLVGKFPFVTEVFPELLQKWKEKSHVETCGLFLEGEMVASYILIEKNNRIIMHTSMNDVGRKKRGVYCLINSIIEKYAGSDKVLDFAGSNIESIHYRNMGFGAEEAHYYSMFYYLHPDLAKRTF